MFVRELVRTIQDVTKTKPKVSIWTEILGEEKKKNPRYSDGSCWEGKQKF